MKEDVLVNEAAGVLEGPPAKETKSKKLPASKEEKKEIKLPSFQEKLFNLANDITELAGEFVRDGYNQAQDYEYVRAQQYKSVFRRALHKNRLRHRLDDVSCEIRDLEKSKSMVLTIYNGLLTLFDVDSNDKEVYTIYSQGADSLDKGLSKAKTLAIKDFIKANFLISDRDDDPDSNEGIREGGTTKKYVPPAELQKKREAAVTDTKSANQADIDRIKSGIQKIREVSGDATYGEKVLKELESGVTATRATVLLTKLELKAGEYDGLEI